jgi:hypothetical protein
MGTNVFQRGRPRRSPWTTVGLEGLLDRRREDAHDRRARLLRGRGENEGENLRNACTEITSADDNDICNLGSINMARIDHLAEFERLVELGTAFLLCGTVYSKVPYQAVDDTRRRTVDSVSA